MQRITYRQKLYLKKTLKILLILLAVLAVGLIAFLQYVERYVVYTADGVVIDYSRSAQKLEVSPQTATTPVTPPEVEISYEAANPSATGENAAPLKGVYITNQQLEDVDLLSERLDALESDVAIMLEVKDIYGYFYYDTAIADAETADVDTFAVSQLISKLHQQGHNLIALVPAFSDYSFALSNLSCGLSLSNGALWMNENNCYWLDPADETVTDYLQQIARELSSMGFSEVVFEDFYFPSSQNIDYSSDLTRAEVVAEAAQKLSDFFAGSNLTISFVTDDTDFSTEGLTGRLYIENIDAAQLERFTTAYSTLNPKTQLVFLTSSKDTRFDSYSTMSPLS